MGRTKKEHKDYCYDLCIGCMVKPKTSFKRTLVSKNGDNSLEKIVQNLMYPQYFVNKEYLPKVICINCKTKLEDRKRVPNFPLLTMIALLKMLSFTHLKLQINLTVSTVDLVVLDLLVKSVSFNF